LFPTARLGTLGDAVAAAPQLGFYNDAYMLTFSEAALPTLEWTWTKSTVTHVVNELMKDW
jgi:hypothetical protein